MKYVALTLSTAAIALLLAVLWAIAQKMGFETRTFSRSQASLHLLSDLQRRDQTDVRHALQALGQVISPDATGLALAGGADGALVELPSLLSQRIQWPHDGIFALSVPAASLATAPQIRVSQSGLAPAMQIPLPNVSVVLSGGAEGKAIVNGHLVRVGDAVGNGLVVTSIRVDVVTFALDSEELHVPIPLERLRVLGAFPNQAIGH